MKQDSKNYVESGTKRRGGLYTWRGRYHGRKFTMVEMMVDPARIRWNGKWSVSETTRKNIVGMCVKAWSRRDK